MDFYFKKSWNVTSVDEWLSKINNSNKNEDGRSAKTLAVFCKEEDAEKLLVETLSPVVGDIHSIKAFPEYHTKIDEYGKGRMHDLAIKCSSNKGNIFVGVEAKVNEDFGQTLISKYNSSKENSNIKKRIDCMLNSYYNGLISIEKTPNIPYQLIYSAVGILKEEKEGKHVLLILVFITSKTNKRRVEKNKERLYEFLNAIKANPKSDGNESVEYYEAILNGQKLDIIYRQINMKMDNILYVPNI